MRVCPVCRTPNLPTNPVCVRCNYQFFASRESGLRAVDETRLPQAPLTTPGAQAEAFAPVEFEETDSDLLPPSVTAPPPMPGPGTAPTAARPRARPGTKKKSSFPRVPPNPAEEELEPLRYDAMQKGLILIVLLVVIGAAVPAVMNAAGLRVDFIGIVGVISYAFVLIFFQYVRGVARLSKKPLSAVEQEGLSRVKTGGAFLIAIPILGSLAGNVGIYFQTNPMHPIYYGIAGIGIFYTLSGVTSLKERYSYYAVFQFGFNLLLLQPLPSVLPGNIGTAIFGSVYWFETTLLFLSAGFIVIAMALRKMRAGQYDALDDAVKLGRQSLASRQYDKALPAFDRAVTIAHSLYADKLFKQTRSGQRVLPADYYEPWIGKATALALAGKGAKALTILDIILEVDGTNAELWVNKGEILLSLNRPAEAYIAFEAAQRLNPNLSTVMAGKTRALERLRSKIE
jgi:hypothetical protein